jgi:hypothetical protein
MTKTWGVGNDGSKTEERSISINLTESGFRVEIFDIGVDRDLPMNSKNNV